MSAQASPTSPMADDTNQQPNEVAPREQGEAPAVTEDASPANQAEEPSTDRKDPALVENASDIFYVKNASGIVSWL